MKGVVEGFWDCPYCDTRRIRGRYYYCPNCGKGRGKETKFYPPEHITEADLIEDREDIKDPDRYCEYCDSYFNFTFNFCPNCGAERGKKDYFDVRRDEDKKAREREAILEGRTTYEESFQSETARRDSEDEEYRYWRENTSEDREEVEEPHEHSKYGNSVVEDTISHNDDYPTFSATKKSPKKEYPRFDIGDSVSGLSDSIGTFFRRNKEPILFISAIIALAFLFVMLLMPRYEKVEVTGKTWSRTINIESYEWVDRSGWSLPGGAQLQYTREEIHHYDKVFDHVESYEVPHTETVQVGTRTVTHDRGNGYFDVDEEPIYETRTYYTTEYRDVYRDEPVYQTKYYYKIQEWVYNRSYNSSGTVNEPYWPDYELAGSYERVGSKSSTYTIIGMRKEKQKSYTTDFDLWNTIQVGRIYEFKVVLGHIVEIVDNSKDDLG